MIELLAIYLLPILIVPFASSFISSLGSHLVWRGEILKFFVISQFFLLGHLLSVLFHLDHFWGNLFMSLGLMLLGNFLIDFFMKVNSATKMITLYLVLQSLQFLLITYFPGLDSHMSVGLFGSVVTAAKEELIVFSGITLIALVIYYIKRNDIHRRSILQSLYQQKTSDLLEQSLFFIVISFSLYSLGFLFTMSIMLLPSVVLTRAAASYRSFTLTSVICVFLSSLFGLIASIVFENLSTVPSQICLLATLLVLVRFISSKNVLKKP